MNVTFTAQTPKELREKIQAFLREFSTGEAVVSVQLVPEQLELPACTDAKANKLKKKKSDMPVAAEIPAPAAAGNSSPGVSLKDEAMSALKFVNDKKGFEAARSLLAGFGVSRFSEIPENKYQEFIEASKA